MILMFTVCVAGLYGLTKYYPDEREQVTAYWTGLALQLPIGYACLYFLWRDQDTAGHSLEIWYPSLPSQYITGQRRDLLIRYLGWQSTLVVTRRMACSSGGTGMFRRTGNMWGRRWAWGLSFLRWFPRRFIRLSILRSIMRRRKRRRCSSVRVGVLIGVWLAGLDICWSIGWCWYPVWYAWMVWDSIYDGVLLDIEVSVYSIEQVRHGCFFFRLFETRRLCTQWINRIFILSDIYSKIQDLDISLSFSSPSSLALRTILNSFQKSIAPVHITAGNIHLYTYPA